MIDPSEDLATQVEKQAKIIAALVERANHQHELGGHSAYALFQSAIALQGKVSEKTRDLEDALTTLGRASNKLETSEVARAQTQQTLADALETMEGGFALFTTGKLRVFNDFFKQLIPDIEARIEVGLELGAYFDAIAASRHIRTPDGEGRPKLGRSVARPDQVSDAPFVFSLKGDRWFVITYRRTSSNNTVLLQTEITSIVRSNRLEKDRLIDAQEHFLQAAFDHMPQGVCTFSAEGTLLLNNAQFGDLLTLPIQLTPVGTAFGQIIDFLKAEALVGPFPHNSFESLIRYLRRSGNLRQRARHINGKILEIDMHPLPDGGCIVNVMDVTAQSQTTEMLEQRVQARTSDLTRANTRLREQYEEQARVEEDLRIAKAEVEKAMSSKTRFFAAASHDLLQPINAAKLMISSLGDLQDRAEIAQTIDRLDGSFRSIEALLHALLDISRLESTDVQLAVGDFPVGDLLRGVAEDLGPLAVQKGLSLRVVPSSLWVRSDRHYLARSLQNLVTNAIQYTHDGRILVGCRRRGTSLVLEVWDTGVGISKADQVRIFKEFTRANTDQRGGYGMGLGLSIVDRACRHLGHSVAVRSQPQVGSVFSIELPVVVPGPDAGGAKPKGPDAPEADMDLIVLLIENDPGVLYAMTRKLEAWGASVLAAEGTDEALALIRDIGIPPDIILADYQLNGDDTGVTGILALRALSGQDIPAVIITANRDDDLREAGQKQGFSVLTKPVNLSRLRPLIDWKTRPGPDR